MDEYRGGESCTSPDGKHFFYVLVNRTSETVELDIYKAERSKSGWSTPVRLTDVDLGFRRISPSVTSNGNLYFSGDYDKPGQKDIYLSEFVNGSYSTPRNLGERINSEYDESHVYVSPDERYLLFDSNRPNENGKTDIYISVKTEDGSWGEAQNIGSSVNSEYSDWYPTVTPDGKYLMFSRNIEGLADIMWVNAKVIKEYRFGR
jgi:Tol biopolymer transport system component